MISPLNSKRGVIRVMQPYKILSLFLFLVVSLTGLFGNVGLICAKESVIRVASTPPMPTSFQQSSSVWMRRFPRILDGLTDNAIYDTMVVIYREREEEIKIHQVHNTSIVPNGGEALEVLAAKVSNGEIGYLNHKLRDSEGRPLIHLFSVWIPLDAGKDNPDEATLELHTIILHEDYDRVAAEASSYRCYDIIQFNVSDLQEVKKKVNAILFKQVEEFIRSGAIE